MRLFRSSNIASGDFLVWRNLVLLGPFPYFLIVPTDMTCIKVRKRLGALGVGLSHPQLPQDTRLGMVHEQLSKRIKAMCW